MRCAANRWNPPGVEHGRTPVDRKREEPTPLKPLPLFCVALVCAAVSPPSVGVSQEEAAGPGAVVTDSAGLRIITSTGGDAIYARVADEAALTIGVVNGPDALMFQRIVSVARDGEGRLYSVVRVIERSLPTEPISDEEWSEGNSGYLALRDSLPLKS